MSISKLFLTESYTDNILDKISSRGIDSLSKYELRLLKLNARREPDQLIEDKDGSGLLYQTAIFVFSTAHLSNRSKRASIPTEWYGGRKWRRK